MAFFSADSYSKSQEIKRRLSNVGLDAIITFGIGREQKGAAQHTWCYTREYIMDDESGDIIGVKFSGVKDNWEGWAANIRAAYEYFMNRITDGELWDNMYKSMYTKRQNKDISYIPVHRMTYTKETLDLVKSWILGGCKDEFPL